jgi:3'-5' exoribonuclease
MSSAIKVLQPSLADAFSSFFLQGRYVLVGFITRIDSNNNPFWLITIADATGTLTMYSRDKGNIYNCLQPQGLAEVEAKVMTSGTQYFYQCESIRPAEHANNRFESLQQLPKSLCPKPEAVDLMIQLVGSISQPCLTRFVVDVLSKPEVGIAYIQHPGSINHHHNYSGGLLEHSVEVAQYFHDESKISSHDRDLGIVASLLHDIGKTQCYTSNVNYTAKGYLVSHDSLTLEICAAALSTLAKQNAGYANQLRHAWTCYSPNSRYGFKPKTSLARKLQRYDRMSAELSIQSNVHAITHSINSDYEIDEVSVA